MRPLGIVDVLTGWSTGCIFMRSLAYEEEVKQGGDYYYGAVANFDQALSLAFVGNTLLNSYPKSPWNKFNRRILIATTVLSLPVFLAAAMVYHEDYEGFKDKWNHRLGRVLRLPEVCPTWADKVSIFLAEKSSFIMHNAMVISSLWMILKGGTAYSAGVILALATCRRVHFFAEEFMPAFARVVTLATTTGKTRLLYLGLTLLDLSSCANRQVHYAVDRICHKIFKWTGPTLAELDTPYYPRKDLPYEEICRVLENHSQCELNPPHFGYCVVSNVKLPEDNSFADFATLFKNVDWCAHYSQITMKLKGDNRFLLFLKKQFPAVKKKTFQKDVHTYISQLALQMTPQEFIRDYLCNEMGRLTRLFLKLEDGVGSKHHLEEAIPIAAKILHHLKQIQGDPERKVEFEDALLELAIAGGYCNEEIKLTCRDLSSRLFQSAMPQDFSEQYEHQLLQALVGERLRIRESVYERIRETLATCLPESLQFSVHTAELASNGTTLGVIPLSPSQRNAIGLASLVGWEVNHWVREEMYEDYENNLTDVIETLTPAAFGVYIPNLIEQNPTLTREQKETLVDLFSNPYSEHLAWDSIETEYRFKILMLVMLGVLLPPPRVAPPIVQSP